MEARGIERKSKIKASRCRLSKTRVESTRTCMGMRGMLSLRENPEEGAERETHDADSTLHSAHSVP